jgi:hypothetical protein
MEVGLAQQRKKEKERRTRKGPMVHMSKEEGEKKKLGVKEQYLANFL